VNEPTPHHPIDRPIHRPIDRRTFLTRAAGTAAVVLGASAVGWRLGHPHRPPPFDGRVFGPPGVATVAVLRAAFYDEGLEATVLDGLRQIGADVHGARVLLKPNMVEYDPGSAINTDPRLVAAAVTAMRRLGAASVTVGEGPGHRRDTGYVVNASGLAERLRDVGAPFVDLNTAAASLRHTNSSYTGLGELWLPQAVTDADVVVSMPKMKTHHWVGVTLSLKNLFGTVPGRVYGWPKNALHWASIEGSILDIAGTVRPRYQIVDGIVGMEGNGPIDGVSKPVGLLVFGDDPVATDVTAATIMGMDPERVPYLQEAGRFLGQPDPARIRQVGEEPSSVITPFAPAPGFEGLRA